jgi:DnaK suppressor protein
MDDLPEELTDEQIAELREVLLALREELGELLASSEEASKTVGLDQPIGRLTRMDAIQQQKMAERERGRRELRRRQVVQALAAIEEGEYGFCRKCEEPVGYARLKARPEAPFCVPCMEQVERR